MCSPVATWGTAVSPAVTLHDLNGFRTCPMAALEAVVSTPGDVTAIRPQTCQVPQQLRKAKQARQRRPAPPAHAAQLKGCLAWPQARLSPLAPCQSFHTTTTSRPQVIRGWLMAPANLAEATEGGVSPSSGATPGLVGLSQVLFRSAEPQAGPRQSCVPRWGDSSPPHAPESLRSRGTTVGHIFPRQPCANLWCRTLETDTGQPLVPRDPSPRGSSTTIAEMQGTQAIFPPSVH